ncbi:hypothetical protein WMY93_029152 [Mugilogobius chulae]|uniref:Uncharacterized protein n=1 Tax=Mugilogobius chulae TaxID=88201 RepID=A0AAW0N2N2_9GOBI
MGSTPTGRPAPVTSRALSEAGPSPTSSPVTTKPTENHNSPLDKMRPSQVQDQDLSKSNTSPTSSPVTDKTYREPQQSFRQSETKTRPAKTKTCPSPGQVQHKSNEFTCDRQNITNFIKSVRAEQSWDQDQDLSKTKTCPRQDQDLSKTKTCPRPRPRPVQDQDLSKSRSSPTQVQRVHL